MTAEAIKAERSGRGRRGPGVPVNAALLRDTRLAAGLTLEQLGNGVVSRAFVHQVEMGRSYPSMRVLAAFADRLQRPVEDFIDETISVEDRGIDFCAELNRLARSMEATVDRLVEGSYRATVTSVAFMLRDASKTLRFERDHQDIQHLSFTGEAEPCSASSSDSA